MSQIANPFSSLDIEVTTEVREKMSLIQDLHDPSKAFPRQIDVWWAGMCIGLREEERLPLKGTTVKFATGVIFNSDPWRIAHLQLIAIAEGGPDAISEDGWAAKAVSAASEYANAGIAWLFEITAGAPSPTVAIYRHLDDVLD